MIAAVILMSVCSAPSKYPKRRPCKLDHRRPGIPARHRRAMDLAVGAKEIRIIMEHTSKKGEPRILKHCTYPLTAAGCVKHLHHLAVIDVTPQDWS